MDPDVAQTLAALERKLADLEHELTSIGGRDSDTGQGAGAAPETVSAPGASTATAGAWGQPRPAEAVPQQESAGTVSEVPAGTVSAVRASGVLVDEAVEQRFSMEAQETVFGEIPATKDDRQSIDLADLVRFKEKMQATLQGLIDEYSQLLSLKPPSGDR